MLDLSVEKETSKSNPTLTVTLIPKSKFKEKNRELTGKALGLAGKVAPPQGRACSSRFPWASIRGTGKKNATPCRGKGHHHGAV
jgi:hypothetical protein